MTEADPPFPRPPGPAHPVAKATLLMIGIVLFLVVVAVLSTYHGH